MAELSRPTTACLFETRAPLETTNEESVPPHPTVNPPVLSHVEPGPVISILFPGLRVLSPMTARLPFIRRPPSETIIWFQPPDTPTLSDHSFDHVLPTPEIRAQL